MSMCDFENKERLYIKESRHIKPSIFKSIYQINLCLNGQNSVFKENALSKNWNYYYTLLSGQTKPRYLNEYSKQVKTDSVYWVGGHTFDEPSFWGATTPALTETPSQSLKQDLIHLVRW